MDQKTTMTSDADLPAPMSNMRTLRDASFQRAGVMTFTAETAGIVEDSRYLYECTAPNVFVAGALRGKGNRFFSDCPLALDNIRPVNARALAAANQPEI